MGPSPPVIRRQCTFEPKRHGVTLDRVAFGAVLGAQGRAWPRGQKQIEWREEEEEGECVRKRTQQEYKTY